MDWYTFYNNFWDWSDTTIHTNIYKLEDIEPEDLTDAVANIFDEKRTNALVRRAIKLKVPVSEDMFQDLSGMVSKQVAKELRDYCGLNNKYFFDYEEIPQDKPGDRKLNLFSVLIAALSVDRKKKNDTGKCDGDCANCPPHYGYRYGRWYYGHGHEYGCERDGNKGC